MSVVPESLSSLRFMDAAVEIVDVVMRHQIVWCYRDWTQLAEALHPVACAMSPPLRPSLPQTSKATLSCPVEGVVSLCCLVVESLT